MKRVTKDYIVRLSLKTYTDVRVRARNKDEALTKAQRKASTGFGVTFSEADDSEVISIVEEHD